MENEGSAADEALKVKIFFRRQAFIIYMADAITVDTFFDKIREILKLNSNQSTTVKWIDNEGSRREGRGGMVEVRPGHFNS